MCGRGREILHVVVVYKYRGHFKRGSFNWLPKYVHVVVVVVLCVLAFINIGGKL